MFPRRLTVSRKRKQMDLEWHSKSKTKTTKRNTKYWKHEVLGHKEEKCSYCCGIGR